MMITEVMKTMMLIYTQILNVLGMVHNNTSKMDATQWCYIKVYGLGWISGWGEV